MNMPFEWMDCQFFLKRRKDASEITMNLTNYHQLQIFDKTKLVRDVQFDVDIRFSRPLMHSRQHGWNWHKCWILPDISVNLKTTPTEALTAITSSLHIQVDTVKPVFSREYSLCVEDVELEGTTTVSLSNGQCVLTGLKFAGTSFNSEGSGFHLLLLIHCNPLKEEGPRILLSRISAPIYVDSRKSVRETELSRVTYISMQLRKLSSYIEPFEPSHLHKEFIKKEAKRGEQYRTERIDNSLEGFINYLSAANIRYKVKHPLFLAIRFSGCFSIYYNTAILQQDTTATEEHILCEIQNVLNSVVVNFSASSSRNVDTDYKTKSILLLANFPTHPKQRYITDNMESFQHDSIGFVRDRYQIPPEFQMLVIGPRTLAAYEGVYAFLRDSYKEIARIKTEELRQSTIESPEVEIPVEEHAREEREESGLNQQNSTRQANSPPQEAEGKEWDQEQAVESEMESESYSSIGVCRPDIPLKCEIVIGPLRKRPMKLEKFLALQTHEKPQLPLVKCDQIEHGNKELSMLNLVLANEIALKKEQLASKANFAYNTSFR